MKACGQLVDAALVVPGEKLVFTWEWQGMPQRQSLETFLLKTLVGGTELTLIHEQLPDEGARNSHAHGWSGWYDRLQTFLETTK